MKTVEDMARDKLSDADATAAVHHIYGLVSQLMKASYPEDNQESELPDNSGKLLRLFKRLNDAKETLSKNQANKLKLCDDSKRIMRKFFMSTLEMIQARLDLLPMDYSRFVVAVSDLCYKSHSMSESDLTEN